MHTTICLASFKRRDGAVARHGDGFTPVLIAIIIFIAISIAAELTDTISFCAASIL